MLPSQPEWTCRYCSRANAFEARKCACGEHKFWALPAYRRSHEYAMLRRQVVHRSEGRCEHASCERPAAQMHHIVYAWRWRPETPEDVMMLCQPGHAMAHPDPAQMQLFLEACGSPTPAKVIDLSAWREARRPAAAVESRPHAA